MQPADVIELGEQLMNSHWPKCNELANEIASVGGAEAASVLRNALKAKRHHVRTAAIKALVTLGDAAAVPVVEPLLGDSSFETRMEAKAAIKTLTGRDVKTARDE